MPLTPRNDLIALLAEIDQKVAEAEAVLLKPLSEPELHVAIEVLAGLKESRERAEAALRSDE